MGYGGSRQDAGRAIGKSGDGGIDGIIKEDRLGLDVIYVQAKRWEGTVGRPEIQKFAGALQGQRAKQGRFYHHIRLYSGGDGVCPDNQLKNHSRRWPAACGVDGRSQHWRIDCRHLRTQETRQ